MKEAVEAAATWDEAISVGVEIIENSSEAMWDLGRLANRVGELKCTDPLLDEKTSTLKQFSARIGQSYNVVKDAARVVRHAEYAYASFPELSYGHWREIVRAGKRNDDVAKWAEKALDEAWTVSHLRLQLRMEKGLPDTPEEKLLRKLVGVIGDCEKLSMMESWRNDPDDVSDAEKALARLGETIRKAREELKEQERLKSLGQMPLI
jgi:hypothetical protein